MRCSIRCAILVIVLNKTRSELEALLQGFTGESAAAAPRADHGTHSLFEPLPGEVRDSDTREIDQLIDQYLEVYAEAGKVNQKRFLRPRCAEADGLLMRALIDGEDVLAPLEVTLRKHIAAHPPASVPLHTPLADWVREAAADVHALSEPQQRLIRYVTLVAEAAGQDHGGDSSWDEGTLQGYPTLDSPDPDSNDKV